MSTDVVVLPAPDHKPFTVIVAAKIRGRIAELGYRQADLAGVLGVSQQSVSKRLTGKVPFDVNELEKVATWLGYSVVQLLGDAGATPPTGPGHLGAQSAGTASNTALRALGSILTGRSARTFQPVTQAA